MTNKELLKSLALIDESYVEAAEKKSVNKKKHVFLKSVAVCAACLCLISVTVFAGVFFKEHITDIPHGTETGISETKEPTVKEKFVIDEGRLLEYNGNESNVIIPDSVTEITGSAFANNVNAGGIVSLYIGERVETIQKEAFRTLSGLTNIEADEKNSHFISKDGVLASVDGDEYYAAVITADEASYRLTEIIMRLREEAGAQNKTANIMLGAGSIEVLFGEDGSCKINYVQAMGMTKRYNFDFNENGIKAVQTDKWYSMSFFSEQGDESALIFTEGGIYEITYDGYPNASLGGFHTSFTLSVNGKSVDFEGKKLNWKDSYYYYEDLTEDGIPELTAVFVWGTGTGVHEEDVHIFNGETLEEYKIEDLTKSLDKYVGFHSDSSAYTITATDGSHIFEKNKLINENKENTAGSVLTGSYYHYRIKNGRLIYDTKCFVSPTETIGDVEVLMKYTDGGFVYGSSAYVPPEE